MIFCAAVITLLSKPSEAKTLARRASKVRHVALPGSRVMVKRLKRSPQSDNGGGGINSDATTTEATTTTTQSSGGGGLIGGITGLISGIFKFIGDILGFIF
ncbi:hypothetical protein AVEN_127155-1 [Araneus ventricosus]|uniref:Uncharacterized protein n=1 Tax=Araneus ventricosus TaxID=182803 RepID=A0A4Y2UEU0_ARAVE|nr:hypothetical protein AVEN_127155-1 [Araneus ventricosus]